jgi:hypothetical protein
VSGEQPAEKRRLRRQRGLLRRPLEPVLPCSLSSTFRRSSRPRAVPQNQQQRHRRECPRWPLPMRRYQSLAALAAQQLILPFRYAWTHSSACKLPWSITTCAQCMAADPVCGDRSTPEQCNGTCRWRRTSKSVWTFWCALSYCRCA